VHVEIGRVGNEIGETPNLEHARPLQRDRLAKGRTRKRVRAPCLLKPTDEHSIVGVQEENSRSKSQLPQELDRFGELVGRHAATGVDNNREPVPRLVAHARPPYDVDDEIGGKVVDHEVPQIFEHVRGVRTSGTGHPGNDDGMGL
jgi:hypothetical protein